MLSICQNRIDEDGQTYLADTLNSNDVRSDLLISTIDVSFSFFSDNDRIESQYVWYQCSSLETVSSRPKDRRRMRRPFDISVLLEAMIN